MACAAPGCPTAAAERPLARATPLTDLVVAAGFWPQESSAASRVAGARGAGGVGAAVRYVAHAGYSQLSLHYQGQGQGLKLSNHFRT